MNIMNPDLVQWLASGERGISSNTMVTHLCGIDALGKWGRRDHPADPDDLGRCRKLLAQVPLLVVVFPNMRTCSAQWAALVDHWDELCALMDKEAPCWSEGVGRAPETYRRMRELIDGACKAAKS